MYMCIYVECAFYNIKYISISIHLCVYICIEKETFTFTLRKWNRKLIGRFLLVKMCDFVMVCTTH